MKAPTTARIVPTGTSKGMITIRPMMSQIVTAAARDDVRDDQSQEGQVSDYHGDDPGGGCDHAGAQQHHLPVVESDVRGDILSETRDGELVSDHEDSRHDEYHRPDRLILSLDRGSE